MLREMGKSDWLSELRMSSTLVPEILVLRGTRHLRRHCQQHSTFFEDVVMLGSEQDFIDDVFIGRLRNRLVGFASVYGPSMAAEIVHIFGVLGTRYVVQTGTCGGLAGHLQIGDLVVIDKAVSLDGVSQHYIPGQFDFQSDILFESALGKVDHLGQFRLPTYGNVITTAALLAEGHAETTAWRDEGNCCVDMETASVFAVAQYFGMKKGAILSVSDLPCQVGHSLINNNVSQSVFSRSEDRLLQVLLQYIADF